MKTNNPIGSWGFGWGLVTGVVLALVALLTTHPTLNSGTATTHNLSSWLSLNLGHSIWLFTLVLALFVLKLRRLHEILQINPIAAEKSKDVVTLDQMLDVWIQVFIGIGVIWTAVGMRSALQSALGDPGAALTDSAGNVLRKLVDGGILLALTTTIVGGVGGYLMRLTKTVFTGAPLQTYYEQLDRQEMVALLEATRRIEAHLGNFNDNVTPLPLPGRAP